jgi:hypothetical protein
MRNATCLLVIGCVLALFGKVDVASGETPGERFRKAIKEIETACAKRKLAPNEVCGEVAKLKPADSLATEEGRFAHSIKIPNPVPEDSGYKPGMTPEQYFDHLCKTEAGEFIFKTVENVEGLYMMRPRERSPDYMQEHLYAMEDPYGYTDAKLCHQNLYSSIRTHTASSRPPSNLSRSHFEESNSVILLSRQKRTRK